jgi:hypothetical protein
MTFARAWLNVTFMGARHLGPCGAVAIENA